MPPLARIAFISDRNGRPGGGNAEIYVMDADGSSLTRLTSNSIVDTAPFWSPDGSKIVFASDRGGNFEIYVMAGDGSNQTRITTGGGSSPTWSPDGSKISLNPPETATWTST